MSTRISTAQVMMIYESQVAVGPLRDRPLLEGAVNAPFQAGFGQEYYPLLVQKAAKLIDGISRAQAYQDGNKRLAWLSAATFIRVNGQLLYATQEDAAEFVLNLDGSPDGLAQGASWLNQHMRAAAKR